MDSPGAVPHHPAKFTESKYIVTQVFVTSLFMLWGIAMAMGDVLNKHFQNVPGVSKSESGLVIAVVGGALFPPLMGKIADADIAHAYYLPIICYAVIFTFGYRFYKAG